MKSTLNKLVALKIPALRGKDAETNGMIIKLLALEGAQTVWNINKLLGRSREHYPTIFRAVNRLKERGYVTKTGTVKMAKKKGRTPTYGLTWRGFIASLTNEEVCSNVLNTLEKNPQILPLPRDVVLPIAKEWLGDEQIEKLARSLFEGLIKTIPDDIESVEERVCLGYLVPTLLKLKTPLKEIKQEDLSRLLKYPQAVNWLEESVEKTIKDLKEELEEAEEFRKWLQAKKPKK